MRLYVRVSLVLAFIIGLMKPAVYGQPGTNPRMEQGLDKDWRFVKADVKSAELTAYDDSQWTTVNLPHTWNNLDGQDGGANYYRGIGWYRKHFFVVASNKGKSFFLQFDGASTITTVYLNGQAVGVHKGAFGRFRLDVSTQIKTGGDNILAVKVSNAPDNGVAPKTGDFTICGGLYRDVNLLITNKVHITTTDYGGPGVYITPTAVSANSAELKIKATVVNQLSQAESITVTTTIRDSLKRVIKNISVNQLIGKNGAHTFNQQLALQSPHLWNAEKDPYLYYVTVQVKNKGRLLDEVTEPIGLRTLRFDANQGFLLNGHKYLIKGVSLHQDKQNKGWALSTADQDESMGLIQEMGANAVRSHYELSPYWYNLCRQRGILVWGEIPVYQYSDYTPEFATNIKEQLRELIRQIYNNPAFIVWSIGNECGDNEKMYKLFAELNSLVKEEDPERPTTYANNRPRTPQKMTGYTDLTAYNWYCGWYINQYEKYGPVEHLDDIIHAFHQAYPDKPIGISEYGAGGSIVQHEENPAPPDPLGYWHPEEYQSYVHEQYWQQVSKYDFFWGSFIWCMFDFASDGRKDGDMLGRNDKGMVSAGREYKKDVFYFYKANWTQAPFTYITSRRANNRTNNNASVKVYANCDEVELFINEQSLGTLTSTDHIFIWKGLMIANGAKVRAVGKIKGNTCKDEIVWNNGRKN